MEIELREGQRQPLMDFGKTRYLDLVHEDVTAAIERRSQEIQAAEEALRAAEKARQAALESGSASEAEPPAEEFIEAEPGGTLVQDASSGVVSIASSEDVVSDSEDEPTLRQSTRRPSVIRFEESIRLNSAALLRVQYGVIGDHEKGVDPEGRLKDADLKKLATTRSYRILIIAPETGTKGFLAVEVISRSHAAKQFPRRLFQAAVGHRYKIKPLGPIADSGAVKKLVEDGSVKEVQLFKKFIPSDSQTPLAEDVVLTFKIGHKKSQVRRILQRVSSWLPKDAEDATRDADIDPSAEAHSLASILWSELEGASFDDVKVKVINAKQKRTLQPLDFKEGFIYDLGEGPVSDDEFCTRVNDAARLLFSNYQMDMEADWYLHQPIE
ncbi:hypothetical protein [Arthrobacter sp. NPDC058192]|uniref:hypothetical protein n=1 Tax=Arthrobacter sp. NPDC058192 TaxID=3346372 RepID=UPI0036E1D008